MTGFFAYGALAFCWVDFLALILLISSTTLFLIKRHKLKKEKEALQNRSVK